MTYALHQFDVFEQEVRRALDYYAVEAPHMIAAFLTELDATMARIAKFPLRDMVATEEFVPDSLALLGGHLGI